MKGKNKTTIPSQIYHVIRGKKMREIKSIYKGHNKYKRVHSPLQKIDTFK